MKLKKIQIMKNRISVPDEEIQRYMNFETVVGKYQARKTRIKKIFLYIAVTTSVIIVGSAAYYFNMQTAEPDPILNETTPSVPNTGGIAVDSVSLNDIPDATIESDVPKETQTQKPAEGKIVEQKKIEKPSEEKPSIEQSIPSFEYLEAEPVDGYPSLYGYFSEELRYPAEAMKDSIQGIVTVSFVINREGQPEQIKIENSLGPLFDQEVIRLIENMPPWKPATLNGDPRSAKISLPITFQIVKQRQK